MRRNASYVHGTGSSEQDRLELQHRLLGGAAFLLSALRPGLRVLEVGCGTGAIIREVAPLIAPGTAVGVDNQPDQLERARSLAAAEGLAQVEFQVGEAGGLRFPDGSFDFAYCRFLLEHVPDPAAVAREMTRVVKAGGSLLACECEAGCCSETPPIPAARRALEALYRLQGLKGGDPYIARRLERIFREAGLRDVRADAVTVRLDAPDHVYGYARGGAQMVEASARELLEHGLLDPEELETALREWENFPRSPGAVALFKLRRVQGMK